MPTRAPLLKVKNWKHQGNSTGLSEIGSGEIGLAEVVHRVKPTMLIGPSSSGSFTEAIVREMAADTPRPIIFALSNPAASSEANPADLIAWSDGRALIATGSPFAPVTYKGVTYVVAQVNNAMLYPGLGVGVIVSQASRISDGMFAAAASAVSSLVTVRQPGASLLPHIDDLRSVSMTVAMAVAEAADAEGLARVKMTDIVQQVQDAMWQPAYRKIQAIRRSCPRTRHRSPQSVGADREPIMATRYNNGSHYQNHQRAAELHDAAAHAHNSAMQQHGKQDHPTGHEQSRRALEHAAEPQAILGRGIHRHADSDDCSTVIVRRRWRLLRPFPLGRRRRRRRGVGDGIDHPSRRLSAGRLVLDVLALSSSTSKSPERRLRVRIASIKRFMIYPSGDPGGNHDPQFAGSRRRPRFHSCQF